MGPVSEQHINVLERGACGRDGHHAIYSPGHGAGGIKLAQLQVDEHGREVAASLWVESMHAEGHEAITLCVYGQACVRRLLDRWATHGRLWDPESAPSDELLEKVFEALKAACCERAERRPAC